MDAGSRAGAVHTGNTMTHRIIIVGAGFAGLAAARALGPLTREREDVTVKLFDALPYTTMVPSLPDLAGGRYPARYLAERIDSLIPASLAFHHERVTGVNLDTKSVTTANDTYAYDYLVLAVGSVTNFFGFEQHLEAVHQLDVLDDATRIRRDFDIYMHQARQPVAIVAGGGYTGLELACNLRFAGRRFTPRPRVCVVELKDRILPFMPEWVRNYMRRQAERHGIELYTGTSVDTFDGKSVRLSNGDTFDHVFLGWATGTRSSLDRIDGKQGRIKDGRLKVDARLAVPPYPDAFAAGDAAAIEQDGGVLRKAVNFSRDSGRHAGLNIVRSIQDRPLRRFRPVDLGWVIPFCDVGVGRLFSTYNVRGRLPLSLHYTMCGLRNYNARNRIFFWKQALRVLF